MKNLIILILLTLGLSYTTKSQIVYDTTLVYYVSGDDTITQIRVDSSVVYTQWPIVDMGGLADPVFIRNDEITGLPIYRQFQQLTATTTNISVRYTEFYLVNNQKLSEQTHTYIDDEFITYKWNSTIGFTIILPAINQRLQNL